MSDRFYYERGKDHYTIFDRKSVGGDQHGMYYIAIAKDVDNAERITRLLNAYYAREQMVAQVEEWARRCTAAEEAA